ncbi:hypothetical protein Maq22A_1p36675 (plasmid) [Methylobacterium aquaticum]|uniref:Uncharacterized protein n=1 Tax=Methylobacterium aquaticum TaxID=270351 RepID=A0A0C6FR21_9HYPH|nr:hypothetical protein Maq22A_1p36675 [Methylobacterium aquaticum]
MHPGAQAPGWFGRIDCDVAAAVSHRPRVLFQVTTYPPAEVAPSQVVDSRILVVSAGQDVCILDSRSR